MARKEARINLRLNQDVFDTYAVVAEKFNTTVTEMIREIVNDGVELMQTITTIIEAAEAGDKEASAKLMRLFMTNNESRLDLAKAVMEQELKGFAPSPETPQDAANEGGQA